MNMADCKWPECPNKALDGKVYCVRHLQGADKSKTRPKHTRTIGEWMSDLFTIVGPALLILFFLLAPLLSKAQTETFTFKAEIGQEVYEFKVYGDGESLIGAEYTIKIRGKVVERGFGTTPKDNYYVKTENGILTKDGILTFRNIGKLDFFYACLPVSKVK